MARKKILCRSSNGLFVRNLGWKRSPSGYVQHKFYLGREETKATLASLRLEQLWEQVSKRWERENETELYPTDRPVWDGVTLVIADAIRNGAAVARIPLPMPFSAMIPESPLIGDWLDRLQNDIAVIKIELRDDEAQKQSEEQIKKQGGRLIVMGRRMLHNQRGGETLRIALDAYSRWISSRYVGVDKKRTAWGGTQTRQIAFIRSHLPDCPLVEFDTQRVEELLDVLRMQQDPIRFEGGDTNLYAFLANQPTSYTDPTGLVCTLWEKGISLGDGLISGVMPTPMRIRMLGVADCTEVAECLIEIANSIEGREAARDPGHKKRLRIEKETRDRLQKWYDDNDCDNRKRCPQPTPAPVPRPQPALGPSDLNSIQQPSDREVPWGWIALGVGAFALGGIVALTIPGAGQVAGTGLMLLGAGILSEGTASAGTTAPPTTPPRGGRGGALRPIIADYRDPN